MIEVYNQISTIKKSTFASIRLPKMYYYHGDPMPCGWSKEGVIVITPNGLLTPCEPGSNLYPALEFDSINGRKPLAEIIDTAPALNSFNNTDYLPKICQDCSVLTKCRGGCRVTTYLMTGGFFSEDPTCSISDKRNLIDQSFSKT
jgi:pyrroloquinoline quinone biosynthesis protein E